MATRYTQAFWSRALQLLDDKPWKCERCKATHSTVSRPRIIVRVVLTGDGTPHTAGLHLLCTKCCPDRIPIKLNRKGIMAQLGDLFLGGAEKEKPPRGRNAGTRSQAQSYPD